MPARPMLQGLLSLPLSLADLSYLSFSSSVDTTISPIQVLNKTDHAAVSVLHAGVSVLLVGAQDKLTLLESIVIILTWMFNLCSGLSGHVNRRTTCPRLSFRARTRIELESSTGMTRSGDAHWTCMQLYTYSRSDMLWVLLDHLLGPVAMKDHLSLGLGLGLINASMRYWSLCIYWLYWQGIDMQPNTNPPACESRRHDKQSAVCMHTHYAVYNVAHHWQCTSLISQS